MFTPRAFLLLFVLLLVSFINANQDAATCTETGTCEAPPTPNIFLDEEKNGIGLAKFAYDSENWTIQIRDVALCCFGTVLPITNEDVRLMDARDMRLLDLYKELEVNLTRGFAVVEESNATIAQDATLFNVTANVTRIRPVTLTNFKLRSSYYQEFDQITDSLALSRSRDVYNMTQRMEHVAGMTFSIPLSVNDTFLPTVAEFLASPFLTPEVAAKSHNLLGFHEARDTKTYQTYLMSKGKNVIIQPRATLMWSSLRVIRGEATVLLTPSSRIASLRLYAGIHPLRRQSQIDFSFKRTDFPNADVNVTTYAPIRLTPSGGGAASLTIPPFSGIFVVLHDSDTVLMMKSPLESELAKARLKAASKLPRYFQPNALKNQPLFFGLYTLAFYADSLLRVEPLTRRTKIKGLYSTNQQRWGVYMSRKGHADDLDDGYPGAQKAASNVLAECDEMAKQPKEMMMDPKGREEVGFSWEEGGRHRELTRGARDEHQMEIELKKVADENRNVILGACRRYSGAVCVEMLLDQIEYAIANTLGASATRYFFSCYFSTND